MLNVKRQLARAANTLLSPLGLELQRSGRDFEARLVSPRHLDFFFQEIGARAHHWLATQQMFEAHLDFDTVSEARAFFADYLASPYRSQTGGSRFGNLLWLNLLAKAQRPKVVIDSGTFTGASAWALARGAPDAQLMSFDLDLSNVIFRAPNVTYAERDWTTQQVEAENRHSTLLYFDDHVDQGLRLQQAAAYGGGLVVFDDDFDILNFAPMAHSGNALPKISFILDDRLTDGEPVEWTDGKTRHRWIVDKRKLQRLRALIAKHDRLPDLSAPAGIWQLPYRVLTLNPVQ